MEWIERCLPRLSRERTRGTVERPEREREILCERCRRVRETKWGTEERGNEAKSKVEIGFGNSA